MFEAGGDAIIRLALRHHSLPARISFFLLGSVLLTLYGTALNLAPVEFATITGLYVATLIIAFQLANYVFFHTAPTLPVMSGCGLIVAGGLLIYFWK